MADPVVIDCPANAWALVATGVRKGVVQQKGVKPSVYLQAYRLTGEDAPTEKEEGVAVFLHSGQALINSAELIDVYIYAVKDAGSVRVALP